MHCHCGTSFRHKVKTMPIHNNDIVNMFNQTADLLEIKGENQFRIRAYRNAAQTIQSLTRSAAELIAEGEDLSGYPGIGKDLAGKIKQMVETGHFLLLEELKTEIPAELTELMAVVGLGAKRIARLYRELRITGLDTLEKALDSGELSGLEGFGQKTEENIRREVQRMKKNRAKRLRLNIAEEIAVPLCAYLKQAKGVKKIDIAGSFRRRKETIGDLDILATCHRNSDIMEHFTRYEDVEKVLSKGTTRSSVLLRSNLQVDVRVVPQVSYGAAMIYFTGSKEHNIALRKIGIQKKYKLNEYGVFKGHQRVAGKTEAEVYQTLNLPYIEPELRENRGELEAAQQNKLPKLITLEDIRGDLHVHSKYTDGRNTIEEMAQAARDIGYEYIAITDHSQHVTVAGGLKPDQLRKQMREIDKLNEKLDGIVLLKGAEVDILENGKLDLPDDVLKDLDLRVCSIHYQFNLPRDKQTARVLRAMENPYFNILGHPTGRLINERSPYDIDLEKIIKAAKDNGCLLELNAHPDRLDLTDTYCKTAKESGVKVVISTDSHHTGHLKFMPFGIGQARRGWLEAKDAANTKTLKQLKKLLKR